MKTFVLLLVLSITWLLGVAQNHNQYYSYKSDAGYNTEANMYQILVDKNGRVYDWGMFGTVCAGCPCFYTKVMRTTYAINGLYTYYVYFYSNSYNSYGYLAGTYLKGVSISKSNILGVLQNVKYLEYFLINPKSGSFDGVNLVIMFQSLNSDDIILITWQNSVVY